MSSSIYNFSITTLQGKRISLSEFNGKVLLLVNTASKCGFTPQYAGLQLLHEKYHEMGLVVIGFPCNQFGKQEPGDASSIQTGCLLNYGVDFLMSEKIEVNGSNSHPLYRFLKKEKGCFLSKRIKWNFTKFLVDKNGKVVRRYASIIKPISIEKEVIELLKH